MKENSPGCLGFLLNWGKQKTPTPSPTIAEPLPYALSDNFLSEGELRFYHVLKSLIPEGFTLISKVNLADLFYVRRPHENRAARNKIDRKHVDFVICSSTSMQPVLAVELDDSSHNRKDRIERDKFVDEVFAVAQLQLLHVKVVQNYDVEALKLQIRERLSRAEGCTDSA